MLASPEEGSAQLRRSQRELDDLRDTNWNFLSKRTINILMMRCLLGQSWLADGRLRTLALSINCA